MKTSDQFGPARGEMTIGTLFMFASLAIQNAGAAVAKDLFPLVGAYGMASLRIGIAACILCALRRPRRYKLARNQIAFVVAYGAALGLMNVSIYQAFARIPIGLAVAIEVTGPLAVVLMTSRRIRDLMWFAVAAGGLAVLLPMSSQADLDPWGVAFACCAGLCWALYILCGKILSRTLGQDGVAIGMVVAALATAPIAVFSLDATVLTATVLAGGVAVALMSSVLPYTFEMEAMRRLPTQAVGILFSTAPAVAALAGYLMLGERLTSIQWLAIGLVITASLGSTLSTATSPTAERAGAAN
jgi:inner membrane transporter RhtA